METVLSCADAGPNDPGPKGWLMTVFDVTPEGVRMYTRAGQKLDALRTNPNVHALFWFPVLGVTVSVRGVAHVGEMLPPPTDPNACPCEVPSGYPITVVPTRVEIMRAGAAHGNGGGFETRTVLG